jgi:hypothetical protein
MYTSIYLLTQAVKETSKHYQNRWKTKDGIPLKHHILKTLRDGTFERFLHKDFAEKKLPILEHDKDLKGLYIEDETIRDHPHHALKGIDLSYSYIGNTTFKNLNLIQTNFSFTSFHSVTFTNCIFSFSTFYASYLENVTFIECDFLERNNIRNCRFTNVTYKDCFIESNMFHSCRFDERTQVAGLAPISIESRKKKNFNPVELAEIYKGMKDGYKAGNVINKCRKYFFLERQAVRKYILDNRLEKMGNYLLEIVAGYGIKPVRVLLSMLFVFLLFSIIFTIDLGYPNGLVLSTGAYFTNGAKSDLLPSIGSFYLLLFIIESFLGIIFTTLFITVTANVWFSENY